MARTAPTSRTRPGRSRTYTIAALLAVAAAIVGYFGFRAYIYGDDAPPIPVLDDLGG